MKRKPAATVTQSDADLFRDAVGNVRLIVADASAIERPKPPPEARMYGLDESSALQDSRRADAVEAQILGEEAMAYRQPHVDERILRQLKRGQFSVQDEMDLHLLNEKQAELHLKRFLDEAIEECRACVRIIHGKGLHSEAGPILRRMVHDTLRHHGKVMAFSSAPAAQGGNGATLALLSRRQR